MEEKPWKYLLLADWDIPLHTSNVEAVLLFRGKNTPRLGGCDFLFDEELIFETKDLTITHYVDEVQGPGRWAYAAYSRDFKGRLTLCATNVGIIYDTLQIIVNSDHGTVTGPLRGFPGNVLDIDLVVDYGYIFTEWTSEDYNFVEPSLTAQSILLEKTITINANFTPVKFNLTLSSTTYDNGDPIGLVDETLSGLKDYMSDAPIRAINTDSHNFTEWIGINIADKYSIETTIKIDRDNMIAVADFEAVELTFGLGDPDDVPFAIEDDVVEEETVFIVLGDFDTFSYGEQLEASFFVSEYTDNDDEYVFRYDSVEYDGDYNGVPKYKIDEFLYLDENGNDIKDEIQDLDEEYDEEYGEYFVYFTINKNITIKPVISEYDPS